MTRSDGIPDDPADDSNRNHTGKMSDSVRPDPLVEAVNEYMAALESGQRPSRKEFLARHADIADDLAIGHDDGADPGVRRRERWLQRELQGSAHELFVQGGPPGPRKSIGGG